MYHMLCSYTKVSYRKENVIKKIIWKTHLQDWTVFIEKKPTCKWSPAVKPVWTKGQLYLILNPARKDNISIISISTPVSQVGKLRLVGDLIAVFPRTTPTCRQASPRLNRS